jgi:hypothetical protein
MPKRGKKYKKILEKKEQKVYQIDEAIKVVKRTPTLVSLAVLNYTQL